MGKYSSVLSSIHERLAGHAVSSGRLDGYTVKDAPENEVLGADDVKVVAIFIPDINENWEGLAPNPASMTLNIAVGTRRDDGTVAHVEAVEAVLDALEYKPNGAYDPCFDGTIRYPFDATVGNQVVLKLSLNSEIAITVQPVTNPRGRDRT